MWNLKLIKFTLVIIPTPTYCTCVHVAYLLASEPSYGFVRLGYFFDEVVNVRRYAGTAPIVNPYQLGVTIKLKVILLPIVVVYTVMYS